MLKNLSALSAECSEISVFRRALESARCTVCGVDYEERRSGKTVSVVAGKRQVRLSERVGTHNLL